MIKAQILDIIICQSLGDMPPSARHSSPQAYLPSRMWYSSFALTLSLSHLIFFLFSFIYLLRPLQHNVECGAVWLFVHMQGLWGKLGQLIPHLCYFSGVNQLAHTNPILSGYGSVNSG